MVNSPGLSDPWIDEGNAYHTRNAHAIRPDPDPVRQVLPWAPSCSRIVDVGCHNGWRSPFLSRTAPYLGLDVSDEAIRDAQVRYPDRDFRVCRAQDFEYFSGDGVVLSYVLHWMPDPEAFLIPLLSKVSWVIVDEFAPDLPRDVPYIHRDDIVTKKRPWLSLVPYPPAGVFSYRYQGSPQGESCMAAIWKGTQWA